MDEIDDLIGDQDDPYEVFVDTCKLDLLELLKKKEDDDDVKDFEVSGELQSRTEQIKVSDIIMECLSAISFLC